MGAGGRGKRAAVAVLAAAVLATGAAAPASASHGEPNVNYVSLKKRKGAPPAKRYTLRLFTTYAHRGYSIGAVYGNARAGARYAGRNNKTFEEWHITKRSPGKPKRLISRLAGKVKRNGSVRFGATLLVPGATSPKSYRCRLSGFNDLGGCAGLVTPQTVPRPLR